MKFFRQHWYYFSTVLFVIVMFGMGFFGHLVSHIQAILIFSYMAIIVHQFEEYILPGGFPYVTNVLVMGEKETPDRYPLNKKLSFTINVIMAYPFFISAIIFPNIIWLGFATVLFAAVFEFIVHGIVYAIRMKKLYNPGLASTVFLSIPIGIYYFWYITTNNLISRSDYIYAMLLLLGFSGLLSLLMLPFFGLSGRNSKVPFTQAEMERGKWKEMFEKNM